MLIDNIFIYVMGFGILINLNFSKNVSLYIISFIFFIYNIISPFFMKGFHVGKYLFGIKIVADNYNNPSFYKCIIREISKLIYVIPILGIILLFVSKYIMQKREDGKSLHDLIARTKVISI